MSLSSSMAITSPSSRPLVSLLLSESEPPASLNFVTHPSGVVYLDYQATTPCDPRVIEKMIPHFYENFGNPHSRNHKYGWDAEAVVEHSRAQVAQILNANPKEIIFTSGATEANNLALKGVMRFYKERRNHMITCVTEHKCVLDTARYLEQEGIRVTYLPVQSNGLIDLNQLEAAMTDQTALVSIMAVNNEIGVIQSLAEIGRLCRARGIFFHTDAAQAVGKIPLDVQAMNIDLLSVSGHKLYGPKGIGALYVGRKPRVRLTPLITGGGQERGLRSGTLSPALCVGLSEACRLASQEMAQETERLLEYRNYFWHELNKRLDEVYLNGDLTQRIVSNLNISFAYVEGEGLMMGIKELAVSSGSACTSASLEPSYVLRALGVNRELAHTSLRIGFGRFTTFEEVKYALDRIVGEAKRLRAISPLWEMAQEGIDLASINWSAH